MQEQIKTILKDYSGIYWDKYQPILDIFPDNYKIISSLPVLILHKIDNKRVLTPIPFDNKVELTEQQKNVQKQLIDIISKNYVSAKLVGGLGNQMFLIAVGYVFAMKQGIPFTFEKRNHQPCEHRLINDYWDSFLKPVVDNLSIQYTGEDETLRELREMRYIPFSKNAARSQISGYFQSAIYFDDHKPYIRALFEAQETDTNYIKTKYPELYNSNVKKVAIHVRRGDYLKAAHYHHILPAQYYYNAINDILSKTIINQIVNWYVFSDDIEWCKSTFNGLDNTCFITGEKDYIEINMLKLFDDYILANSTFGWWGVYLNVLEEFPHAYVPYKWFEFDLYPHELIGAGWTKITY